MINGSHPFIKPSIILLFLGLATVLLTILNISGMFPPRAASPVAAQAPPPSDKVVGWAWSGRDDGNNSTGAPVRDSVVDGGTGWISFNSVDCDTNGNDVIDVGDAAPAGCPPNGTPIPNYGVTIPLNQRTIDWYITGYAWAGGSDADSDPTTEEGIGWIRFDPANVDALAPEEPKTGAYVNIVTGHVTGWARACSVFESGCGNPPGRLKSPEERGGWDGWIKLSGDWDADGTIEWGAGAGQDNPVRVNVNYGNVDYGKFSGFAWGGGDYLDGDPFGIGWIDFRPSSGFSAVKFTGVFNRPPECTANNTDYFTNEDADPKIFPIIDGGIANCNDPDGDPLTITALGPGPTGGTACISNGTRCVASGPSIQYQPRRLPTSFVGTESITYTVDDGRGLTTTGTIIFPVYDCGNDTIDPLEQCDTNQFGGKTCRNQGRRFDFIGGDLTCTNDQDSPTENCKIHTDQCKKFRDVKIKED